MAKRVHVRLGIGIHVETRLAAAGAAECFWSSVRCASIKTVQNTQAASGRAKCVDKGGGKSAVKRSHCLPPLFEGKIFHRRRLHSTRHYFVDVPPEFVIFDAKLLALKK